MFCRFIHLFCGTAVKIHLNDLRNFALPCSGCFIKRVGPPGVVPFPVDSSVGVGGWFFFPMGSSFCCLLLRNQSGRSNMAVMLCGTPNRPMNNCDDSGRTNGNDRILHNRFTTTDLNALVSPTHVESTLCLCLCSFNVCVYLCVCVL